MSTSSTPYASFELSAKGKLIKCVCTECQESIPLGYNYLTKRTHRMHQDRKNAKKPRIECNKIQVYALYFFLIINRFLIL